MYFARFLLCVVSIKLALAGYPTCEFDLVEDNINILEHLPIECQEMYENRLTDPVYLESKKESTEFSNFQAEISKLERIVYNVEDFDEDSIEVDYGKRMKIYGNGEKTNVLVLDEKKSNCVEKYKDFVGVPIDSNCVTNINITFMSSINSTCDSNTESGTVYDCLAAERAAMNLRFKNLYFPLLSF